MSLFYSLSCLVWPLEKLPKNKEGRRQKFAHIFTHMVGLIYFAPVRNVWTSLVVRLFRQWFLLPPEFQIQIWLLTGPAVSSQIMCPLGQKWWKLVGTCVSFERELEDWLDKRLEGGKWNKISWYFFCVRCWSKKFSNIVPTLKRIYKNEHIQNLLFRK